MWNLLVLIFGVACYYKKNENNAIKMIKFTQKAKHKQKRYHLQMLFKM